MPLIFDDKTFDTLSDSMDEIFPEIVSVFFEETESSINQMKTELTECNIEAVRGIAHKLKSSAKTFGAISLVEILENIENTNNVSEAESIEMHQNLMVEFSLVKQHILAK